MKHLITLILIFNFICISNASVDPDFEPESTTHNSAQPLMIMYNKSWHQKNQVHNRSLVIQFADLRLTDDIYGINGLVGRVTHQRTYWNPFLYKVSKGGNHFHLLGTMHIVPLCALPPFVKDVVFGCETLIRERYVQDKEKVKEIVLEKHYDLSHTWFNDLTSEEQVILSRIVSFVKTSGRFDEYNIDSRILPGIYEQVHFQFGMYSQIQDSFRENKKVIQGLDTFEEHCNSLDYHLELGKEVALDILRSQINQTLENKGYLQEPYRVFRAQVYLNGYTKQFKEERPQPSTMSAELAHNKRWWQRLMELLDNPAIENPCIVVGAAHCVGEGAFLDFAFQDGWIVEKYSVNYYDPAESGPYFVRSITRDEIV